MRVNYAIIFVSDMDRSVAFYRDVIGMPLKFASSHWTEFATDGATWALHLAGDPAQPDPEGPTEPAGSARPGFSVADIDAFHARMQEHHVPSPQPPTLTFGSRIALYRDPDGLYFSVSEAKG